MTPAPRDPCLKRCHTNAKPSELTNRNRNSRLVKDFLVPRAWSPSNDTAKEKAAILKLFTSTQTPERLEPIRGQEAETGEKNHAWFVSSHRDQLAYFTEVLKRRTRL